MFVRAILSLWVLVCVSSAMASPVTLSEEEQAWMAQHSVVRVGVDGGYAPYSFKDGEGFKGIALDILSIVSERTGLTFQAVPDLSWPEIVQGSKDHTIDVIATASHTVERESFLNFTPIYLPTPLVIMTRNDEVSITSAEDMVGKRIALVKAYSSSNKVLNAYPDILPFMVDTAADGLRAVSVGQADAYVGVVGVNDHVIRQIGLSNLKVAAAYEMKLNGQRFGVRKDWPLLVGILNKGLATITQAEQVAIFNRWLPIQNALTEKRAKESISPLKLTAQEQAWLKANPKIKIGIMEAWPPMDFTDEKGQPQGIGADTVKTLDAMLGGGVLHLHPGDWSTIYHGVKNKKLDAVMGITPTEARAPYFHFTSPYLSVPHAIFAHKESPYIAGLKSLQGKTVVVEKGFFVAGMLMKHFPSIHLMVRPNTREALYAVSKGEADAYVGNRAVAQYLLEQELITNVQEMALVSISRSINTIGVRKDWPTLQVILQKGLDQISVEQKRAMAARWVKGEVGNPNELVLTEEEKRWLQAHPTLRLGVQNNRAPYEYRDRAGFHRGIASDYIALLDRYLKAEMQTITLKDSSDLQRQRARLDLVAAMTPVEANTTQMLSTRTYLQFPLVMMMHRDAPLVKGIVDLKGRTVSVVQGVLDISMLAKQYPWVMWRAFGSSGEAMQALSRGEVAAHLDSIPAIHMAMERFSLENLHVVTPTDFKLDLAFGVREDWPELRHILDKIIQSIPEAEKHAIIQSWLRPRTETTMDWAYLWKVVGSILLVVGIVLALVMVWNRRLSREIEERKRVEEELSKLHRAVEQTPVSVVITDLDGRIEYVNPTFCKSSGYDASEVVGRTNRLIKSGHTSEEEYTQLWAQITAGGEWTGEFLNRTKNGELIWERVSISPVRSPDGVITHYLGIKEDISQMKRDQETLARAKESADRANRAKSSFLANMSHEIRTPMNAIVGMCHLAQRIAVEPQLRDYLGNIQVAADTLLGIINDILDISKIEAGKLNLEEIPFQLEEVINRMMRLQGLKAQEKRLELIVNLEPDVPGTLMGDPLRLNQVLTNLVNNAIKFTEQGEVVLTVELAAKRGDDITLAFEVRDTGIGMDHAQMESLFAPFQQADDSITRRYGGTGLGLSICRNLVQMMGGELTVESVEGQGCRFHFSLDSHICHTDITHTPERQPMPLGLRVLVVDDNAESRRVLHSMLASFGYDVDLAESGISGVQMAHDALAQNKPYDLVLMDWQMPQMDGIEAGQKILDLQQPDTQAMPVMIMVTAYGNEEARDAARGCGFKGYLEKPITPSTLYDTILTGLFMPNSADAPMVEEASWQRAAPDLSGHRVLVVEDNAINQALAQEMLALAQLQVITANHGQHALEVLAQEQVDLIFMDIQMPVMDGFSATRAIRENPNWSKIPIIAMTAHALEEDRQKCLDGGMNDHLGKPIDPELLYAKAAHWLGYLGGVVPSLPPGHTSRRSALSGKRVLMAVSDVAVMEPIEDLLQQSGVQVEQAYATRYDLNSWQPDLVMVDRAGYESPQVRHIFSLYPHCFTILVEHEDSAGASRPSWANDWVIAPVESITLMATLQYGIQGATDATEQEGIALPAGDEHICIQWALAQGAGNRALLNRLMGAFVADHGKDVEQLGLLVAKKQWVQMARLSHALAGVAGGIGAMKLHALAKRLELHGEKKRDVAATRVFNLLIEEMEAVMNRLQPLSEVKPPLQASAQTEILDDAALQVQLRALQQLIHAGDPDAVEVIASLKTVVAQGEMKNRLDQLDNLLQDYEFEAASEQLDAWLV
ncbi:transporter substrate-binding domain-containing protein [Magnetococcus sp. PR-3]|uniref:transporter substrate-binding domain-containing protein n=1 Tax=Magnetococcus sp. PR-3 TaxID=3120355 RepID=UPI002FCE1103